jgi:FAD/FMN-containing dehydrogenase
MTAHLSNAALEGLRRDLRGDALTEDSPGYEDLRRSFNAMLQDRPAVIAAVESVDDVVRSLSFGRAEGLAIGIRGGGHSVAGHGIVPDGLVIDMRRLNRVDVDAERRLARSQGGATWLDMDTATQHHGLAVTGGTFVDTGVAGLSLGGGIGYLMGVCGLTCDNIVGAQLVTADGRVIEVDAGSDPDLLWALRGGGGNFGVVTRLDLALAQVGRMWGGDVLLPLGDGAVLRRLSDVQRSAPDTFVTIAFVNHRPELGPVAALQVASLADEATSRALFDAIVAGDRILDGELRERSYAEIQAFADVMPFEFRHYWKSAFVPDLSEALVDTIVGRVRSRPMGKTGVLFEPIHGAARRFGHDHAPFPQREARYHVSALGIWEDEAADEPEIAWVRETHAAVTALGTTGTYVNYIAHDEPADRASSTYPPEVLERLRAVKRRVDPENVFRSNLNIAPG